MLNVYKETDKATNVVTYRVQLPYQQDGPAILSIQVLKGTSKSQIETITPIKLGKVGGKPLSGRFLVHCKNAKGQLSKSKGIEVYNSDADIQRAIGEHCAGLRNKIRVTGTSMKYHHWTIGRQFRIEFWDINWDPALFEIVDDPTKPLKGKNIVKKVTYDIAPTTNIFYQPIPYEMLRTHETKPQVIVNVDGLPAACHNLTCDFTYIATAGEVTEFTYTAGTRILAIKGTAFPEKATEMQKINFAHTSCTMDATKHTKTSMECKLDKEPTCGKHIPVVTSIYGIIPGKADLAKTTIGCTITNVVPTSGYNLLGGTNITFTGTNFPHDLATSTVSLEFSDTAKTKCIPQTTETTKFVCLTNAFAASDVGKTLTLDFKINDSTVTK